MKLTFLLITLFVAVCNAEIMRRLVRNKRLVGGKHPEKGEYPWSALIIRPINTTNVNYCGATIINERWLLTAAHCFQGDNSIGAFPWKAIISEVAVDTENYLKKSTHRLKMKFVHPKFKFGEPGFDVGLMKLERSLRWNCDTGFVKITPTYDKDDWPSNGEKCTFVGWGCEAPRTAMKWRSNVATMPILDDSVCYDHIQNIVHHTEFCAGYQNQSIGICMGDAGSGLICEKGDREYVAGIAVRIISNSSPRIFPGLFTRVSSVANWIEEIMAKY